MMLTESRAIATIIVLVSFFWDGSVAASGNNETRTDEAQPDEARTDEAQTHVYQVKNSSARDVAATLQSLIHAEGNVSQTRTTTRRVSRRSSGRPVASPASIVRDSAVIVPHLATNRLFIQARAESYKRILDLLSKIDVQRRQVFIEVACVQVRSDSKLNDRIERVADTSDTEKTRRLFPELKPELDRVLADRDPEDLSEAGFPLLVRFFREHPDSEVLAKPFLRAHENEECRIDLRETRFVKNTSVTTQTVLSSHEGESAGISLSIVPAIGRSGKVVFLEMDLTVSEFGEAATNTLPPKRENTLRSSLTVPVGEIFVLGGLTMPAGRSQNDLHFFIRTRLLTK